MYNNYLFLSIQGRGKGKKKVEEEAPEEVEQTEDVRDVFFFWP